jgi:hypothetical protein
MFTGLPRNLSTRCFRCCVAVIQTHNE